MAARIKKASNVDLAALNQKGDIVDVDNLPTPIDEMDADLDTSFSIASSTSTNDGVTASTHEPESEVRDPEADGYVNVFYHPATRKYVQYNRNLEGRADFQLKRVAKDDFDKLGVRA